MSGLFTDAEITHLTTEVAKTEKMVELLSQKQLQLIQQARESLYETVTASWDKVKDNDFLDQQTSKSLCT